MSSLYMNEEIFNKESVAAFLRVKPRTIQEWMKKGLIPYSKLPSGSVRFRRSSIMAWREKFATKPEP
jgi:excisionase family DNA binding protein